MRKIIFLAIIIPFAFGACQIFNPVPPTPTPFPPTPTPLPPKELNICLGYEPESLYPYAAASQAARNVMQAIYDGPIDTVNGQPVAVILEKLPNFNDGSARFTPVGVNPGDTVVNSAGYLVSLQAGVEVFPSGCSSPSCVITYDGASPLQMDQITAVFKLKPGLKWSDGQPLTADDSVYSFLVASDPLTPVSKQTVDQTASYATTDELTIEWISQPGLVTDAFERYFRAPLPEHAWGAYSAGELLTAEEVNRMPLGWGAYMVEEWLEGESIRLVKNPYYFRADEGLPYFDQLIFIITDRNGDTNLSNLKFDRKPFSYLNYDVGEFDEEVARKGCDLTTSTADMRDQFSVFNYLLNYLQDPAIKIFKSADTETLFLLFNLGKDELGEGHPQNSVEVRRAISKCIDRQTIIQKLSSNLYNQPDFIVFGHEMADLDYLEYINYEPESANTELENAGWVDHDRQSETQRLSSGIEGYPDGKELMMTFLVEDQRKLSEAAEMIKSMLSDCGIGSDIILAPTEKYWDIENDNSIFQSQFDIALISWKTPILNPCLLFSSDEIPFSGDGYLGTNFSGFSDPLVDTICQQFGYQMFFSEKMDKLGKIQKIINAKLPLIPIYSYSNLLLAQKDFCSDGFTQRYTNELSGIEDYRISPDCP